MASIFNLILTVILLIITAISAGFAAASASSANNFPNLSDDQVAQRGRTLLIASAVTGLVGFVVFVALLILMLTIGFEAALLEGNIFAIIFLVASVALAFVVGGLSAGGTTIIQVSDSFRNNPDNPSVFRGTVSAVLGIIGAVIALAIIVFTMATGGKCEQQNGNGQQLADTAEQVAKLAV